jgi:hypothetical protein
MTTSHPTAQGQVHGMLTYMDVAMEAIDLRKHNLSDEFAQIITDMMLVKYPEFEFHIMTHLRITMLTID